MAPMKTRSRSARKRGDPSHSDSQNQQRANHCFQDRKGSRQDFHGPQRKHVVGIDGHGEEEMVVAEVPTAIEMELGIRGDERRRRSKATRPTTSSTRGQAGVLRGEASEGIAVVAMIIGGAGSRNSS